MSRIDAAKLSLSKKVKSRKETVITVSDKDFAVVKAGDKVTVKYTTADGKNTAKTVKRKPKQQSKQKKD